MIGTKAFHKLGEISRLLPCLCIIEDEDDEFYIGHWVEGFGFMNVKFPKSTTRPITSNEVTFLVSAEIEGMILIG